MSSCVYKRNFTVKMFVFCFLLYVSSVKQGGRVEIRRKALLGNIPIFKSLQSPSHLFPNELESENVEETTSKTTEDIEKTTLTTRCETTKSTLNNREENLDKKIKSFNEVVTRFKNILNTSYYQVTSSLVKNSIYLTELQQEMDEQLQLTNQFIKINDTPESRDEIRNSKFNNEDISFVHKMNISEKGQKVSADPKDCFHKELKWSYYDTLRKKWRKQESDLKRRRKRQFVSDFYSFLLQIEGSFGAQMKKINLSSIVHLSFLNRLRYANEEIVNDIMQEKVSVKIEKLNGSGCEEKVSLQKSWERFKTLQRIVSLLLLALPWSPEEILSTQGNDELIDYIFRPSSRYIFDVPCRKCFQKVYGTCMEIFFCKNGAKIRRPPPIF